MNNLFDAFLKTPRGIRYKLTIAFALMSVIPMLVFGYLVIFYIFPKLSNLREVSLLFVFTIFLMVSGFYLAKKIILPVIKITAHAKVLVGGKLDKKLEVGRGDEIGELGNTLNQLSGKLKENMNELRSYGEKIKQINMEINRKMLALSSLLQINNLLTSDFQLNDVFALIAEKLSQLQENGPVFLMLSNNKSSELSIVARAYLEIDQVKDAKYKINGDLLSKVYHNSFPLIIDSQRTQDVADEKLSCYLPVRNIIVMPVTSSGRVIGLLGLGNDIENFVFTNEEIELISVFVKQVTMAVENDLLQRKTQELTITDELTGLYNEKYIRDRLEEEIKRAISYQRPCSFMVLEINNFEHYRDTLGEIATEETLKKIAKTFRESASDIDKIARFNDYQFAAIFPEKNKRQSSEIAGNIVKEISRFAQSQKNLGFDASLKISSGISSAPLDGEASLELINKALYYTEKAKETGDNVVITS